MGGEPSGRVEGLEVLVGAPVPSSHVPMDTAPLRTNPDRLVHPSWGRGHAKPRPKRPNKALAEPVNRGSAQSELEAHAMVRFQERLSARLNGPSTKWGLVAWRPSRERPLGTLLRPRAHLEHSFSSLPQMVTAEDRLRADRARTDGFSGHGQS